LKSSKVGEGRSQSREAGALSKRTQASASKMKEGIVKPHSFLRKSSSSSTRAFQMSSAKKNLSSS